MLELTIGFPLHYTSVMSKTALSERTEQEKAHAELCEDFARAGGLTHYTYTRCSSKVVTSQEENGQEISRTVEVQDDGTYRMTVYNHTLDKQMAEYETDDLDLLASWDVSKPYSQFVEPVESYRVEEPNDFYELDKGTMMRVMRSMQKVNGNRAVKMSVAVHQIAGVYADAHDPFNDEYPDRRDRVRFAFTQESDARYVANVGLRFSVYDWAEVEVWGDKIEVEFGY